MNHSHNIHQLLDVWGAGERRLPERNDELKAKIIAGLPGAPRTMPAMPRRVSWLSFAFAGLAVLVLLAGSSSIQNAVRTGTTSSPTYREGGAGALSAPSAGPTPTAANPEKLAPDYYSRPYPQTNIPVTDTREFLKTDYIATIRTRSVDQLAARIETTVRGFGGRVDNATHSPHFGFVNFAVPASKFDTFRQSIETLVSPRFITVETRTENLLPQKQSIEEQTRQVNIELERLRADRQKLVDDHTRAVSSLRVQLTTVTDALAILRAEQTNDPVRKAQIAAGIQELLGKEETLQAKFADENASSAKRLNSEDALIKNTEANLSQITTQDQNLVDTVATVRGTITLNWISIWEIVGLYVSPYWIALLLVVAALATNFLQRRRYREELP